MSGLVINYNATEDLKSYSTWLQENVDQNASTWDSTTGDGTLVLNEGVTEIGGGAFDLAGDTLNYFTLPEGITEIGGGAFAMAASEYWYENTLVLPSTITFIGCDAFQSWDNVTVKCLAVTPPMYSHDEDMCHNFEYSTLYVPESSVAAYQADSAWSSSFPTISPIAPEPPVPPTPTKKSSFNLEGMLDVDYMRQ